MRTKSYITVQEFTSHLRASDNTKRTYADKVRRYLKWLNGKAPSEANAQVYIDQIEQVLAPNSVAATANAIRAYFKAMKTPITLSAPGVQFSEPKYLSMGDFNMLLIACRTPLEKCLVSVLFDTGCRISEILNLNVADIDWGNGLIKVMRKGGRIENVNITQKGADALKEWLDTRGFKSRPRVFGDINYWEARELLKGVAKKAGIKNFTIHWLRHTRAIQMLDSDVRVEDVQRAMGHTNINTTLSFYGRLRPMDLKKRLKKSEW